MESPRVGVIIPARNEAGNIAAVLAAIPDWVSTVVVVDNGSTDGTDANAREGGAIVLPEPVAGYGRACLRGIAHLEAMETDRPEIVVFLDGDYSDFPEDMARLTNPIARDGVDLVIGSRLRGGLEPGAMTLPQRFGNRLATFLIKLFWNVPFTDLGPFRAIRMDALRALGMRDKDFGWTVEMQVEAARRGLVCAEVPVRYRRRLSGKSQVSGTIRGTVLAGTKILWVVFRAAVRHPRTARRARHGAASSGSSRIEP